MDKSPAPPPRLLDVLRQRLRYLYLHDSLRTEEVYVHWVRRFVRWSGGRHPRTMGRAEGAAFLSMLANPLHVSVATHRQALSALLFHFRELFGHELPWLRDPARPASPRRVPVVLSRDEVAALLGRMQGVDGLLARLLYGGGMRLMEGVRLRARDVDFERRVVVVRQGHGDVSTAMIYTHVLKIAAGATPSPLDALDALDGLGPVGTLGAFTTVPTGPPASPSAPARPASPRVGPLRTREPAPPCHLRSTSAFPATPSSAVAATSAS